MECDDLINKLSSYSNKPAKFRREFKLWLLPLIIGNEKGFGGPEPFIPIEEIVEYFEYFTNNLSSEDLESYECMENRLNVLLNKLTSQA